MDWTWTRTGQKDFTKQVVLLGNNTTLVRCLYLHLLPTNCYNAKGTSALEGGNIVVFSVSLVTIF